MSPVCLGAKSEVFYPLTRHLRRKMKQSHTNVSPKNWKWRQMGLRCTQVVCGELQVCLALVYLLVPDIHLLPPPHTFATWLTLRSFCRTKCSHHNHTLWDKSAFKARTFVVIRKTVLETVIEPKSETCGREELKDGFSSWLFYLKTQRYEKELSKFNDKASFHKKSR